MFTRDAEVHSDGGGKVSAARTVVRGRDRAARFEPVEGRTQTGDTDLVLVELSGKAGDHKLKKRQVAVDLENDAEGPLPGLASRLRGKPIGGDHVRLLFISRSHEQRLDRRPPARDSDRCRCMLEVGEKL